MKVKISMKTGEYTLIGLREDEGTDEFPEVSSGFEKEAGKITRVSSTDEQPYICANFDKNGVFTGGRTISRSLYSSTIAKAEKAGLEIDYLAWMIEA